MKKKLTAMLLALGAGLAPALCTATNKVSYYDPTDSASPHKEVDCTLVSSSTLTLTPGWYAVDTDVTMGRITVNGSGVNLILCDGATLNATNGVRLAASNSLTIYGQRQGTGALFALWPKNYCAGIGGNNGEKGGTLTVNGGWMKVWGGQYGAAIGGGCAADGGKLVVNGGTIIAEGYNGSAAIGGGDDGSGGEVEINGGHVTAIGSRRSSTGQASAGIGAGRPHPESDHSRTSGTVKITGGTVIAVAGTAQGSGKAAQAIGVNLDDKGKDTGTLTLGDAMLAYESESATSPVAKNQRTTTCRSPWVMLVACRHDYEHGACRWCGAQIPVITDVVVEQPALWDGTVDVSFTVTNDVAKGFPDWNRPFLSIMATDNETGSNYVSAVSALSAKAPYQLDDALYGSKGEHAVTWDMYGQGIRFASSNVTFTVAYIKPFDVPGEYCIIDLSGGKDASSYPVSYVSNVPNVPAAFNTDDYKTTKLAMRLIEPESEGKPPFYCAIFETTQRQWELVTGDNPSQFKNAADSPMRPVEQVSWNMIRGNADTYDWPNTNAVYESSFLGVLRLKSGFDALDLPTAAQWEYACRAGTTTQYSYGDTANGDYMWFQENSTNQTHAVGTKRPNAWDLYDMHGNVWEWCLDRYCSPGSDRVERGGGRRSVAGLCTSSYRGCNDPSVEGDFLGFRLVRTLSDNLEGERSAEAVAGAERVGTVCTGASDPVAIVLPSSSIVEFGAAAYSAAEGEILEFEVVVKGGNATMPSRAAVYISYLTAAAADLDLKNGAIDGVTPKGGLKFPLLLTWDAGDTAPKKISIPVKADKTVEGYESFVLQLAECVGMGPGETVTAWATIADKNEKTLKPTVSPYKPKKDESVATNEVTVGVSPSDLGFAAGSGAYTAGTKLTMVAEARPGCAFVGWERNGSIESDKPKYQIVVSNDVAYTAKFAAVDYMCGLADPADGGKVTGSGFCPAGKKVTLKAAANKGFAFLGWGTGNGEWGTGNGFVATTPSLVIDRTAKPAKDSKTSTTISNLTESATFYAVFTGDPLVSAIPVLVDGDVGLVSNEVGKVTGAGRYAPGKKVTLKATASKGFAFSGFFDAEGNLLDETRSASYSFEMPSNDVPLTARFVTVDEDQASIKLSVAGEELSREPAFTPAKTNFCGVAMNWSLAADALSATTIKVAGLPSGLKFTAKDILKKGSKTEVEIPANTIYGAPTAASKTDKNGNVTPSKVVFTVKTAGKSTQTFTINLYIDPLPAWAVGTFDGATYVGDSAEASGLVQAFTVAANGKISGKMLRNDGTWTLAADSFASYDAESDAYLATVVGKNGKLLETNEVTVAASGVSGLTASAPSLSWTAYQNLWKRADTKADMPVIKKDIVKTLELGDPNDPNNTLKLTFKKDGAVAFAGKVEGASVSGSSQLVRLSEDGAACRVTLYAPPKPTAKPPFKGFCKTFAVTLTLDEQKIVINAVLVDEILDDWLNGNPDGEGDEDFYGPSQGNGDCQSECD